MTVVGGIGVVVWGCLFAKKEGSPLTCSHDDIDVDEVYPDIGSTLSLGHSGPVSWLG